MVKTSEPTQASLFPKGSGENEAHEKYRFALYYCYVTIESIEDHISFQNQVCISLSLHGRVRVASEGINGVLSGTTADLVNYETLLKEELRRSLRKYKGLNDSVDANLEPFFELDVKLCKLRPDLTVAEQLFDSLFVKATGEVIQLVEINNLKISEEGGSRKSRRKQKEQGKMYLNNSSSQLIEQIWSKCTEQLDLNSSLAERSSVPHLSPDEWNHKLNELGSQPENSVLLLDCRNFYESNVGYFAAPNTSTLLTNTRKYSELPELFVKHADRLANSSHVLMYCTGGVRCERASLFLKYLLEQRAAQRQPEIYQLHGGIQRYLEHSDPVHFHGKIFVFDPRRVDPHHGNTVVGRCLLCQQCHDDYDNGHAPSQGKETRCCHCRSLILVCADCRTIVHCWGDEDLDTSEKALRRPVFCGGLDVCLRQPPVHEIKS